MPTPKTTYLKDYIPPTYTIDTIDLYIKLYEDYTDVVAKLSVRRLSKSAEPLVLNGEDLDLISVKIDNQITKNYQLETEQLILKDVPAQFTLEINNQIKPQLNTQLSGLYKSNDIFCTQCEAHGFRRITYFIDRPDVMSLYTTTIEADKVKYPVLLSNGNIIDQGPLDGHRHFVKWQDPFKKPCYLFALVAGDLKKVEDFFVTSSGKKISLRIFVEPGNEKKCAHAMQALKQAMRWDEVEFGREYDLDLFMIVAIRDFNMGAMENKGLNVFNEQYILANPKLATDTDFEGISIVVGHEYFHNWTGNRITCRDWFQLSLKEGLTVFRDQEFYASIISDAVARIQNVKRLRISQFAEDAGPLAHPVRPESYIEMNNFYTSTVYNKGAEVVRMLQTILGVDGFRKGMDLYFQRHDGQAVTTDDFVKVMEDANHVDLAQFLLWYSQAGTPVVDASGEYSADKKTFSLTLRQSCPDTPGQNNKKPFYIPIAIGLLDKNGKDIPLTLSHETGGAKTTRVLVFHDQTAKFDFINIPEAPVPSLLRNFSAPIKLNYNYSDADLMFLWQNDSDGFNRWEASHRYTEKFLLSLITFRQKNEMYTLPKKYLEVLKKTLTDTNLEPGLSALMLTLPSEPALANMMEVIDVDNIHFARNFTRKEIAVNLEKDLLRTYEMLNTNQAYVFDTKNIGQRSLKNVCLAYLCQLENNAEIRAIAFHQFRTANNMTDQLAALSVLNNIDCPERDQAMLDFYQQYQNEPLVIDKWFALQAQSELADTLVRVQNLMRHKDFTLKNPNRVRALIGAFCAGNPFYFHAFDGKGYQFLADQIIALNDINPQIAARLIEPFSRWRRYDADRQEKMQQQLERIQKTQNLSKDVFELTTKILH